jgi:amino acid transporter
MSLSDTLFGRPLATTEATTERVGTPAGIALLGLDALSSAAYGPEAAMTVLLAVGSGAVGYVGPITAVIIVLLTIVFISYLQTIGAYPHGGGSYTVAKENLGVGTGLVAAAALLIDYVLVVAVGISAGVGALISAVPSLAPHTLSLCLGILAFIALVNLRGVRESGTLFLLPTYAFVGSLGIVIVIGLAKMWLYGAHPAPLEPPPLAPAATAPVTGWLLLRAFASGCTAMTGVEAVSNGVPAFRDPSVTLAQRTLAVIIGLLILLLAGVAALAWSYGITATDPGSPHYQSVLSLIVVAVVGRGWWYYGTMASVLVVLALSANTAFADFPRLCRLLANDGYLPRVLASRGRRLVYSHGIVALTALAGLLLAIFGGVTDRLIPLFAIGAFLAFTLSQAGMVAHWARIRTRHAGLSQLINGVGALATSATLVVVLVAKFVEGAWLVVLLLPALVLLFVEVSRHYRRVAAEITTTAPLDTTALTPPLVIIPMHEWNRMSQRGLRFGLGLSPDVRVVQILATDADDHLTPRWPTLVEAPAAAAHLPAPALVTIASPYRFVFGPLLEYILRMKAENPGRQIAVLIPELVARRWYHNVLHNQRAALLKALLLIRGGDDVIVINVPWYLQS